MIITTENVKILEAFVENYGKETGTKLFENVEPQYYEPSESVELYDSENDEYYSYSSEKLRSPEEYDQTAEGYTPFGDE